MQKFTVAFLTAFYVCIAPAWAEVRIANGDGATIDDIIRDKSLVTIMLKGNARDANLIVTGVNKNTITFETSEGDFSAYPLTMVVEVRIQEDRLSSKKSVFALGSLTREEKLIVDHAAEQLFDIFKGAQGNQALRMSAAQLMAVTGNEDALTYLKGLAEGNDTPTSVRASLELYSVGEKIDVDVIHDGFLNGNRETRTMAALLAGLSGNRTFLKKLREMLADPSEDVYPSAARALAVLNDRASLPLIYKGLESLRQPKSEAAIFALKTMGDQEIIDHLNSMLPNASQTVWFRINRVLYALGDEDAEIAIRKTGLTTFVHEGASGLLLGENEDWAGISWIREYLEKKKDPDIKNLLFRAHLGSALYDSAQAQAKIVFQKLMRMTETEIYAKGFNQNISYKKAAVATVQSEVCRILGQLGDKSMLSILTRAIDHPDPYISLVACSAAIEISNPEYRKRSMKGAEFIGYRELLLPDFFK